MKKINILSKAITLLSFVFILIFCLLSTRKQEINLRYLDENIPIGLIIVISCIYSSCFVSFFSFLLIFEFFKVCCGCSECGNWEREDIQPNKHTFFYFILNGLLILNVLTYFFGRVLGIEYQFIGISAIFIIWTIIYSIRCCKNPKAYCIIICSREYLNNLAIYPFIYFHNFYNDEDCGCREDHCTIFKVIFCPLWPILTVGALFGYYIFLLFFVIFWLLIKMFISCGCCKCDNCCDCSCCSCCGCCLYCDCCICCFQKRNKNNQNISSDNENDVYVTRLRVDAVFFETNGHNNDLGINRDK